MRGYDRDEYEDYDDYEEEREEEEEGGEEEEYEEEEERKPSAEELEYLELRARIKEQIRKKMQKENGSALAKPQEKKKKLPSDNYGSFFGPSQPVIAQRVIQESKSLLENQQHLARNILNSHHGNKKSSSTAVGSKNGVHEQRPKLKNELQKKVQKLKDTRDYSFLLSDDAEFPAPKESAPRNFSTPNPEARSTQVPQKSKQLSGSNGRNIHVGREERRPVPMNGQLHSKVGSYKPTSASKPNLTSMDSRRHLASNNGVGPGRPGGPKGLPSKIPVATMEKKASASGAKHVLPGMHRPPSSKMQSSAQKQHVEQRKGLQEPSKAKMMPKNPSTSSKPQINKPVKQISSRASQYDNRPKKKPVRPLSDDEDEQALSMIRRMFNTQRFVGRDDDDSDMEANFDDIMREERRSAKIAREEDEEELRLIEEEERRKQMKKKRKLSQH